MWLVWRRLICTICNTRQKKFYEWNGREKNVEILRGTIKNIRSQKEHASCTGLWRDLWWARDSRLLLRSTTTRAYLGCFDAAKRADLCVYFIHAIETLRAKHAFGRVSGMRKMTDASFPPTALVVDSRKFFFTREYCTRSDGWTLPTDIGRLKYGFSNLEGLIFLLIVNVLFLI